MHINTGNCPKCDEVMQRYPGFHPKLWEWFKTFQKKVTDAHVSCCGRGKADQEAYLQAGTSRASYGKSAHNANAALDIFRLTSSTQLSYDRQWFRDKVGTAVFGNNANPEKQLTIIWYGAPGARFQELPHCEVEGWAELLKCGELKLVE